MLDNLSDFEIAVKNHVTKCTYEDCNVLMNTTGEDDIFCPSPKCAGIRKVKYKFLSTGNMLIMPNDNGGIILRHLHPPCVASTDEIIFKNLPWLIQTECLQCSSKANIIIFEGPCGVELTVLHSVYGGCVTQHTPEPVKFYIDQAYRASLAGANSAAMAMYRSALEWILHHQGFTEGMLGRKTKDLEEAIQKGNAPDWTKDIRPDYLATIKNIGNGAVHTNGGDISKQQHLDKEAIKRVGDAFKVILDKIYEAPFRAAQNRAVLQELNAKMSNNK